MSVELLQNLSLASYIIAAVLFLVSIALFFLLDVPKLYGDVSGQTAKKAIEAIRQQNEATGNKAYKPSFVNEKRGKLTEKITDSGVSEVHTPGTQIGVGTEKLSQTQSNETTLLEEFSDASETTVLRETFSASETTVLAETLSVAEPALPIQEEQIIQPTVVGNEFTIDVELSFAESLEIIE